MRSILIAALLAASVVAGCASKGDVTALQRPHAPPRWALDLQNGDPFSESIAVSSVTGISQYSWFFPEANRSRFKPLLESALARAGLLAPSPDEALYHLEIDFSQSEGTTIGGHMDASTLGTYRVVDAVSRAIVYETTVEASAVAHFPGLTEEDFVSGRFIDWLLLAPLWPSATPNSPAPTRVVNSLPSSSGQSEFLGAYYGPDRSDQVIHLMMQQSIARFIRDFAAAEGMPIVAILPCGRSPELDRLKMDLTVHGRRWTTTACRASDLG